MRLPFQFNNSACNFQYDIKTAKTSSSKSCIIVLSEINQPWSSYGSLLLWMEIIIQSFELMKEPSIINSVPASSWWDYALWFIKSTDFLIYLATFMRESKTTLNVALYKCYELSGLNWKFYILLESSLFKLVALLVSAPIKLIKSALVTVSQLCQNFHSAFISNLYLI